ncbi:preprotein translocase subunit SecA [Abyssibacter sp.]|uniref:preprotein translocase subunit SecA n=1 Tax=Abyssibacter sp. TaxID=2320200 RepID=UPI0025BA63A3|nr:preprotein translocase subunit SecA [Abyssibacter sp.]MCK5858926.1 preprotein translocase subunit SecA [Abyssibacter sp.]
MANTFFSRLIGSRNQRVLNRKRKFADQVNALESSISTLDDAALQAKTTEFRGRLNQGESLDALLPEAFAVIREAAKRTLGMRHFDVQVIGGAVLHDGKIAEMRTGEGKTLVATLATYANALTGKGVHIITVNDYLASRDAEWMGRLYRFMGLSVGVVLSGQTPDEKRAGYAADITYGTNNEFGFDYLRDNMAFSAEDKVQRGLHFAVVDEVDSILIDEARTPLIISGPTDDDPSLYQKINSVVPNLVAQEEEDGPGDFSVDEKGKQVHLTEDGHERVEQLLSAAGLLAEGESLYDAQNIVLMHHLNAALRARYLFKRDVDYIVRGGDVVIVDEFTGRTMPGRRWSDGLHQAIEAKEGVAIQRENQTLASITFQNYFRLYDKLAGMTGTADTEAFEFQQIYSLEVVVIPTNKPTQRQDLGDLVFMTAREKFNAIVDDITAAQEKGAPVLVGTASIETSELLHQLLTERKVSHEVLNAKQHEREAEIIAQAGRPGAVTIATNMAGRGTDIVLGGSLDAELSVISEDDADARAAVQADWQTRHDAVIASGGLHVIGSERHESRRIDNQLRGRSGRQGDPGLTRFYLSLEDTLMRIFTPPRMRAMLQRLGMEEGEAIEHRWVSRSIETAQRKVESHNFDIRKHLLEYDNVANDQRKVIYAQRNDLMEAEEVSGLIDTIRPDVVAGVVQAYLPPGSPEELWDTKGLSEALRAEFGLDEDIVQWLEADTSLDDVGVRRRVNELLETSYADKKQRAGESVIQHFEKAVMLQTLDRLWREHLAAMDYLRQGINLRAYAQRDPKQEYKREAFQLFNDLLARLKHEVVATLSKVRVQAESDVEAVEAQRRAQAEALQARGEASHAEASSALAGGEQAPEPEASAPGRRIQAGPSQRPALPPQPETFARGERKIGRNEPCPCGSGKKYKQCHGQVA